MKNVLKKIAVLSLSVACACMGFPQTAQAAENDEMVAIHVQTPSDWENPCAWAWNEDGTNAFEAWPGDELDVDADNAGWYYIYVPEFANHVIINANDGGVQTEEIVLEEGKESWITISDAENNEVSYDALTTGELPEYVAKFAVHARVDASWEAPCLWAWSAPDGTNVYESWPGKELSYNEESGWYTAKVPEWVNSVIINGNGGEVQTEDLSIDPAEVWITVDADGKADYSYVDPDKAEAPNVTVHVMAPSDWDAPNLWAWSAPDGTNVYSTWPGEALEEGENGWLTKEIPGWVNSIIVNGNGGEVQTSDISIETGKDVWVVVNGPEDYEVTYEEPEVASAGGEVAGAVTDETKKNTPVAPIAAGCGVVAVAAVAGVVVAKKKKAA